MCRWDRNAVTSYQLTRRGASFAAEESTVISGANNARPVGIAVGRGGRLFVTALYMAGNMASPYCASDLVMVTRADDPAGAPFESYDIMKLSDEQLWTELSTDSWERRSRAHQEILRRGGPLLSEAPRRLKSRLPSPLVAEGPGLRGRERANHLLMHPTWLAAASGSDEAIAPLSSLADHADANVRQQAISALATLSPERVSPDVFLMALGDENPSVQLAALAWYFKARTPLPLEAVLARAAAGTPIYVKLLPRCWPHEHQRRSCKGSWKPASN